MCVQLELEVAAQLFAEKITDLPKTSAEFQILITAVYAELKTKLFLFVAPGRARFYQANVMSANTKSVFPKGCEETVLAGNCYALELDTACVFHCMRALEHGLGALAADLGLNFDIQK